MWLVLLLLTRVNLGSAACGDETVWRRYEVKSDNSHDLQYVRSVVQAQQQDNVNKLLEDAVHDGVKAAVEYLTEPANSLGSKRTIIENGRTKYIHTGYAPVNYKGLLSRFAAGAAIQVVLNEGFNLAGEDAEGSTSAVSTQACPSTAPPLCTTNLGFCTTSYCVCDAWHKFLISTTTKGDECYQCRVKCNYDAPDQTKCNTNFSESCVCDDDEIIFATETTTGVPCKTCLPQCTRETGKCTLAKAPFSLPSTCGCAAGLYFNRVKAVSGAACARCDVPSQTTSAATSSTRLSGFVVLAAVAWGS